MTTDGRSRRHISGIWVKKGANRRFQTLLALFSPICWIYGPLERPSVVIWPSIFFWQLFKTCRLSKKNIMTIGVCCHMWSIWNTSPPTRPFYRPIFIWSPKSRHITGRREMRISKNPRDKSFQIDPRSDLNLWIDPKIRIFRDVWIIYKNGDFHPPPYLKILYISI